MINMYLLKIGLETHKLFCQISLSLFYSGFILLHNFMLTVPTSLLVIIVEESVSKKTHI